MKLWLIFIQGDEATWLAAAWDDESTVENPSGWREAVAKARQGAEENDYEMRIASTDLEGVYELFDVPALNASAVEAAE